MLDLAIEIIISKFFSLQGEGKVRSKAYFRVVYKVRRQETYGKGAGKKADRGLFTLFPFTITCKRIIPLLFSNVNSKLNKYWKEIGRETHVAIPPLLPELHSDMTPAGHGTDFLFVIYRGLEFSRLAFNKIKEIIDY